MTDLLTIPEAAERLRVSRSTAYGYARAFIIPTIRIGGVVRVPADALESWLLERQVVHQFDGDAQA